MSPFDEDPADNKSELDLCISEIEQLRKALRDISNAEDELKAKGIGYNVTVDTIAKIALGDI